MAPRIVTPEDLDRAARAALGGGRRLDGVERLAGGTRKGVYRLTMDDTATAIAYLWEDSENFWPQTRDDGDRADQFSAGVGSDLFEAAHHRLASLGLRVPEVYLLDRDRRHYSADIAIVEDVSGGNLLDRYKHNPTAAEPTLARVREGLAAMREYRGPSPGKVGHVDGGGVSRWRSCEEGALDFAVRCLAEAAARDRRIADARGRLEDRLRELAAAVRPRAEYSVVHGELGLDHILVDREGNPVIIDIEDLMYFDVEWEHVFMQIRLHEQWAPLVGVDALDADRMALYMLTQRLSLTAGPLRMLDGDFPNRAFMEEIAEYNRDEALALLASQEGR